MPAPDASSSPQLSVVIVNYNTRDETVACVRSLLETTALPIEVLIVDNGSVDDSAPALRALADEVDADVRVIEAGANLGFAKGVNLGARHASTPWVLLLNPDTVILPGAVDAIHAYAVSAPEHGLYGGRTLRPDGSTDPSSCWGAMSLWSLTCFALGLSTLFKRSRIFDPESLGRWDRDTLREVPIITGCLLLMATADWNRLGGMDERFFLYGEDAEFSGRAIRAGMRPIVVPGATIIHAVGGSTASSGRKMAMVMAGKATVVRTAWKRPAAVVGIALLQAGSLLRAVPALLRHRSAGTWVEVWRSRRKWRDGYPAAKIRLFGIDDSSTQLQDEPASAG